MRKYYCFIIKKDFKEVYIRNSEVLYQTLYNLYKIKKEDYRIGLSLYNQICSPFYPDFLIDYIKDKYHLKKRKHKYLLQTTNEKVLILLKYSCVILISDVNLPAILKILYLYNKNIFVVDFKNHDYFWLTKEFLKRPKTIKNA